MDTERIWKRERERDVFPLSLMEKKVWDLNCLVLVFPFFADDEVGKRADADETVKSKKQLKEDRNAAVEALGKMDIS